MQSLYYLLGLGVGAGLVVQVGMNSTLRSLLGSPIVAALISFLVGSLALAVYAGLARTPLPLRAQLAPCHLGLARQYLAPSMSPLACHRLGAGMLRGVVFGSWHLAARGSRLAGFPQHPLNLVRVLGAGAAFGGVLLIPR